MVPREREQGSTGVQDGAGGAHGDRGRPVVSGRDPSLPRTLGQFGDPGEALEEFAAFADRAADRLDSSRHLANAAMTMATQGHGTAAIYGRVHASVTGLYAVMKNGERVDWPIYDGPRNQERYFAVIAGSGARHVVQPALTSAASTSRPSAAPVEQNP